MGKYRIVVGTSKGKSEATKHYNLVTKNQIHADIKIYKTDSGELYSVETGPYSKRKEVLQDLDIIKSLGIINAFITNA